MHYTTGIKSFADLFSRYPVGQPDTDDLDLLNYLELSIFLAFSYQRNSKFIINNTRNDKEAAMEDQQYQTLLNIDHHL